MEQKVKRRPPSKRAKTSEERFRLILESAHEAFISIDREGRITAWNPAAEETFGWQSKEIVGRTLSETIIPGKYREDHRRGLKHLLSTGEGPVLNQRLELTALHRDGREFPIELTISHLRFKRKDEFYAFLHDISARKRAERQLSDSLKELKRSNRELEEFAYVASHDLQEPLRMISSFMQLLEKQYEDKLDARATKYIHFASDGAMRMQKLIQDLLTYSKVGREEFKMEDVDCSQAFALACENLSASIEDKKATITAEPLPVVRGCKTYLVQLFQNLIANSLKFSGPQAPHIYIKVEQKDRVWQFASRDNGIGIDPKYSDQIFGIFQRLHGQEKYPGTGIGLAICKKVVERHGGKIWVDCHQGEGGSTFYFTIPVKEESHLGLA